MSDYLTLGELEAELGNLPRYVRQVRQVAGGDRVAWQGSEDQVTWFTLGERGGQEPAGAPPPAPLGFSVDPTGEAPGIEAGAAPPPRYSRTTLRAGREVLEVSLDGVTWCSVAGPLAGEELSRETTRRSDEQEDLSGAGCPAADARRGGWGHRCCQIRLAPGSRARVERHDRQAQARAGASSR